MENKEITRLSLTVDDVKMSWTKQDNACEMTELIEAFYGLCVGHTFLPSTVLTCMKRFVEEHLEDERDID